MSKTYVQTSAFVSSVLIYLGAFEKSMRANFYGQSFIGEIQMKNALS